MYTRLAIGDAGEQLDSLGPEFRGFTARPTFRFFKDKKKICLRIPGQRPMNCVLPPPLAIGPPDATGSSVFCSPARGSCFYPWRRFRIWTVRVLVGNPCVPET